MAKLTRLLDDLEKFYGPQVAAWPTDPYGFIVWWQCGYPPSEERCQSGWEALTHAVGVGADQLLAARRSTLARLLQAGGIVPELRAQRLQSIAKRVRDEYGGDLAHALAELPVRAARAALKKFPGIADPGADRILLFGGLSAVAAVPSNAPHVLVRIANGKVPADYRATYQQAQRLLDEALPPTAAARTRAYLLLQEHGQRLCKRNRPLCEQCPVRRTCAYFRDVRTAQG
jgi:endonuclease-3